MTRKIVFITLFLVITFNPSFVCAVNRVAFVVGNNDYKSSPLQSPVNDAQDMAYVLKNLGFEVLLIKNADKKSMISSLNKFSQKLSNAEIGIFYFAGHGIQINGTNYLIPVNNNIQEESEVEFKAIDAGRILNKMEKAGNPLNIVILDACRDNPFKRSFRTSKKGLAKINANLGTVIAYATSPGTIATDGDGRHGTYTKSLLKNLQMPNFNVQKMLHQTRLYVMKKTNKKQVPWVSTTPFPDYFLAIGTKPPVQQNQPVVSTQPQFVVTTSSAQIIAQEDSFVKFDNGIIIDTNTNLEWYVGPDKRLTWNKSYNWISNLTIAGGGWRMPTLIELKSLYRKGLSPWNMSQLFKTTGWGVWSVEKKKDIIGGKTHYYPMYFSFNGGYDKWAGGYSRSINGRTFAVRVK